MGIPNKMSINLAQNMHGAIYKAIVKNKIHDE